MPTTLSLDEKRWLKYVFFTLVKGEDPDKNGWDTDDYNDYLNKINSPLVILDDTTGVYACAQGIWKELNQRSADSGQTIDPCVRKIVTETQYKDQSLQLVTIPYDVAISALAKMCVINGIEWDPSKYTAWELNYFYKTDFGHALKQYQAEASDVSINNQAGAPSSSTNATGASSGQTGAFSHVVTGGNYVKPNSVHARPIKTRTPGVVKSTYKQLGPQSANAYDLKSVPGQKVTLSGEQGWLFCVSANDTATSRNRPFANVNPLIDTKTYRVGSTNKVKFDSAHGYSDLILYFNTYAEADAFLAKMKAANLIPGKIVQECVSKQSLISGPTARFFRHGFYEIGTELGNAYVCAFKLNEALAIPQKQNVEETDNK